MWLQKLSKVNELEIAQKIKNELINSIVIQKLSKQLSVPAEIIGRLNIQFVELEKEYAETDATTMKINKNLLKQEDFFDKYMLVFAHETVHYLIFNSNIRLKGDANKPVNHDKPYFNDDEEILGFEISIAYLLSKKYSPEEIKDKIYPKIEFHFKDKDAADQFYDIIYRTAFEFLFDNKSLLKLV